MTIFNQRFKDSPIVQPRTLMLLFGWMVPAIILLGVLSVTFEPALAVAAAIGLCVAAYMFVRPTATTMIVMFALYANLMVVAIRSYGVPELLAGSFLLLLGLPFLNYTMIQGKKIVVNRVLIMMVVYLGLVLTSAAISERPDESVDRLIGLVTEGIALYFLIINTIRTPKMLRRAVWTIVLAGMFMGSISLYQEITKDYDNDFGGLAVVKDAEISTGEVDAFGDDVKRQRLAGPVGSKNRYAQIMVVLFPMAIFFFFYEKSWYLKMLAIAATIPIISGALLTFSRGAGISIILTLLAMVALRTIKVRQFILIGLFATAVVLVAIPDYVYRLGRSAGVLELAQGNAADAGGSVRGRATVNLAAFNIFLDNFLLGVGPGQTKFYTTEYGNAVGYRHLSGSRRAHNMFLEEMADTGILGFGTFMGIVGFTLWKLFRLRMRWKYRNPQVVFLVSGIMLAILAYLSTAVFLHLSYVRYYWVIIAIGGAAIEVFSDPKYRRKLKVGQKPGRV
ncbi:MAG: O-antigen ligase family protein [Chloroflexota bacterium]